MGVGPAARTSDLDPAGRRARQLSGYPTLSVEPAGTAGQLGQDCGGGPERRQAGAELDGSEHGQAYLNVVDVQSGAVWASTSPVAVDGESWTLLLWQVQEQGIRWQTTVSDGGRAIEEAVSTVTPKLPHQRDVWHVLHLCQQVQARLDRQVEGLQQRTPVVARQAARLAAGKRPRGKCPKTDVAAHAAELSQAQYACEGLRYLSGELRRLLGVVVLTPQGIMPSAVRQGELETVLILLDELSQTAFGHAARAEEAGDPAGGSTASAGALCPCPR